MKTTLQANNPMRGTLLQKYRGDLELARTYLKDAYVRFQVFMHGSDTVNDRKFLECVLGHIDRRINEGGFFNAGDCVTLPQEPVFYNDYICTREVGHFVATLQEYAFHIASRIDESIYWLDGFETDDKRAKDDAQKAVYSLKRDLTTIRLAIPLFSAWLSKHGGSKSINAFDEMSNAYWHVSEDDADYDAYFTDVHELCNRISRILRETDAVIPLNDAVEAIHSILTAGDFHEVKELFSVIYDVYASFTAELQHFCAIREFEEADK